MSDEPLGGSFRDPSGFVFERDGELYRRVRRRYAADYDQLLASGLYDALVAEQLLIPHEEVELEAADDPEAHRTLRPERVSFVSYPYEWCFSQLRDAALATLRIQRIALQHGMSLKDANATNVQFHRGAPTLIDTLSFECFEEGRPWVAYRQFCQHFLAPLALVALRDVRLMNLLRVHVDGVPLDLACALLPRRAWLRVQLLLHLRVHAAAQRRHAADAEPEVKRAARPLDRRGLENLLAGLESACSGLDWKPEGTEWADYDAAGSYGLAAESAKVAAVTRWLNEIGPDEVWDLGANRGDYARIASGQGARTLAFDVDPACVEQAWRAVRQGADRRLLPLVLDLANPSPALGWAHEERASLVGRASADLVLALALIHHLAISNNVPLERIARFFAQLAPQLVIEFVPKDDPRVAQLLATREDVFPDYTRAGFERAFERHFERVERVDLEDSDRALYRMRRRAS